MPKKIDPEKEHLRLEKMKEYEYRYPDNILVCGVDEAGRGPLAGPVSAGAVILPRDAEIFFLNDSKKLTEKKRDELYEQIKECAIAWNVATADHETIDRINILQADYQAMRDAVQGLSVKPQVLFNDAVIIPDLDIEQVKLIHGDALSVSIAAASIMAKVTRDRMMYQYDTLYPEYGFARNKGYGTAEHIAAIRKYGPCPIHRMTFIRKFTDARE